MSVVKRKRKESPFEVFHHLTKMRKDITDLLLRGFGYSNEKFQNKMEKWYGGKPPDQLTDVQKRNIERQRRRAEHLMNGSYPRRETRLYHACMELMNMYIQRIAYIRHA